MGGQRGTRNAQGGSTYHWVQLSCEIYAPSFGIIFVILGTILGSAGAQRDPNMYVDTVAPSTYLKIFYADRVSIPIF